MEQSNQNYIAGEWLSGESEIENINPSDTRDCIGMYAQAVDGATRSGHRSGPRGAERVGAQGSRAPRTRC